MGFKIWNEIDPKNLLCVMRDKMDDVLLKYDVVQNP